jgi:hypothetical protein
MRNLDSWRKLMVKSLSGKKMRRIQMTIGKRIKNSQRHQRNRVRGLKEPSLITGNIIIYTTDRQVYQRWFQQWAV